MKKTRAVKVGNIIIGGENNIVIQSMTNTMTSDVEATVAQIKRLEEAGCQLVRMTINNMEAAEAIKEIKKKVTIPLAADIHFDYKLALAAMENGIDKLRINPGNIGADENVAKVVQKAKEKNKNISKSIDPVRKRKEDHVRGMKDIELSKKKRDKEDIEGTLQSLLKTKEDEYER